MSIVENISGNITAQLIDEDWGKIVEVATAENIFISGSPAEKKTDVNRMVDELRAHLEAHNPLYRRSIERKKLVVSTSVKVLGYGGILTDHRDKNEVEIHLIGDPEDNIDIQSLILSPGDSMQVQISGSDIVGSRRGNYILRRELLDEARLWCDSIISGSNEKQNPDAFKDKIITTSERMECFSAFMSYYFIKSGALYRLLHIMLHENPVEQLSSQDLFAVVESLFDNFLSRLWSRYNEDEWKNKVVSTGDEYEYSRTDAGQVIQDVYRIHAERLGISEEQLLQLLEELRADSKNRELSNNLNIRLLTEVLIEATLLPELFKLQEFGVFHAQRPHSIDLRMEFPVSRPEFDTFPSFNPFIRVLEFLALLKLGIPLEDLQMHTTVSDAFLDKVNLEMIGASLLAYIGGVFFEDLSPKEAKGYREGESVQVENAKKSTHFPTGRAIRFPYLKGRQKGVSEHGKKQVIVNYGSATSFAVEHRSLPMLPNDPLQKATLRHYGTARHIIHRIADILIYNTLTGSLVGLVQKAYSSGASSNEIQEQWINLENVIRDLLSQVGLSPLSTGEKYIPVEEADEFMGEVSPADRLYSKVIGFRQTPWGEKATREVRELLLKIAHTLFEKGDDIPPILSAYFRRRGIS